MKVQAPYISNSSDYYTDVVTYIQVGAQDWKFTLTLDKENQVIYDSDPLVADHPDGCFDDTDLVPPGVVLRAYDLIKPQAQALLEALAHTEVCSIQGGILTRENGETLDLMHIQALLTQAYLDSCDNDYADAFQALSSLTGRRIGAHGDVLPNSTATLKETQ